MTASIPVSTTLSPSRSRYRHALWLLTKRDLSVRYTTNALGYVWSILDPLLMAAIYYFVFVVVFHRGNQANEHPYMVFLLAALLPWTWFNSVIGDCTKAFKQDAKLVRSTSLPRSVWVGHIVLSKGIEFLFSLPVLAFFAVIGGAKVNVDLVWFLLGIVLEAVLCLGLGLIIAPVVVFFTDLERAVRLILRALFYASCVMYSPSDLPHGRVHDIMVLNPLVGIFDLFRAGFFPTDLDWKQVGVAAVVSFVILGIGLLVFRRTVPTVLKEM